MTESMVERVARALAEREIRTARRWDTDPAKLEEMLPAAVDYHWPTLADDARAAIEAMRDPTPKMLHAAAKALSPGRRPTTEWVSVNAKHGIRYRAMIDAALEVPAPSPTTTAEAQNEQSKATTV